MVLTNIYYSSYICSPETTSQLSFHFLIIHYLVIIEVLWHIEVCVCSITNLEMLSLSVMQYTVCNKEELYIIYIL